MKQGTAILILAVSIVSVAISQLVLKARLQQPELASWRAGEWQRMLLVAASDPVVWLGIFLVLVGAACWYVALTRLPVSFMLPVAALIAPITTIGAYFFLDEGLTLNKLAAIGVIVVGVVWLGLEQS
jgi:drug/metabolite transporter (DMT)-like permease